MKKLNRAALLSLATFSLSAFYGCPERPELNTPAALQSDTSLLQSVDPFIGTGGFPWARGNVSPAASAPFGRIKVGPDTTLLGKRSSTSGYGYLDTHLLGFSHTRLSGTGAFEGGLLRFLPLAWRLENFSSVQKLNTVFDKSSEKASPGYYSIFLPKAKVQAELSATPRTALHRYTFHKGASPRHLLLHLNSYLYPVGRVTDVSVALDLAQNKITVQGKLKDAFSSRYGGLTFYFTVRSSVPWQQHRFLSARETLDSTSWAPGDQDGKAYLDLDFGSAENKSEIVFQVALSYASAAGAERVFSSEATSPDLDTILVSTRAQWLDLLNRIQVEGGTPSARRSFYTGMYQSFLMPVLMDDPSGASFEYLGFDQNLHLAAHNYYSDFSLWDTFRTVHPLYNLILRERHPDMLKSIILMADQGDVLPRWPSGNGNTGSMQGLPAISVFAESALKGLGGWDENAGYAWAKKMLEPHYASGQLCLLSFLENGFCPNAVKGSVSYVLDYAYAIKSLADWAQQRGDTAESELNNARALKIKNHWSARRGFFAPFDSNGKLDEGINEDDSSYLSITRAGRAYVEGNAWHWAFSPFNMGDELFALAPDQFVGRLNQFFLKAGDALGSPFGAYGYWHGNEHDYHAAYLFALAGRPDLTQKWARWIMDHKYRDRPMGIDGDDDGGSMASWYVWSALGIFPVAGSDRYVLSSPLFNQMTINRGGGDTLTISAPGDTSHHYISGVARKHNEATTALMNAWVTESQISDSSRLEFTRSPTPELWNGVSK